MKKLKLSIIMPAYNEGEGIKNLIDKLISLRYKSYELIIVDDGSTDCSPGILDEYDDKFDFIKVIHQENQGCVYARKKGISQALGEFITFVDADDIVDDEYFINFERAVCNEADYYILNNKLVNPINNEWYVEKDFLRDGYIKKEAVERWILTNKAGAVWDKIYKTSLMKFAAENLNMKIVFGDDVFINMVYLKNVNKIFCQDSSSYVHNKNSTTSVCKQYSYNKLDEINTLALYILNSLKNTNDLKNEFSSIVVYNYLETVNNLLKSNKKKDIYNYINSLQSYQIIKKEYQPHGIKNKVYYYFLFSKITGFMKILFEIKNKRYKI